MLYAKRKSVWPLGFLIVAISGCSAASRPPNVHCQANKPSSVLQVSLQDKTAELHEPVVLGEMESSPQSCSETSPSSVGLSPSEAPSSCGATAFHDPVDRDFPFWSKVFSDQANYYSPNSLTKLGAGFLVGGVMANTSIDDGIQRHFQSSVRGASSDEWFEGLHANSEIGNGLYTLPLFAAAWAGGRLLDGQPGAQPIGEWGERSLRTFLVGAPPMWVMQLATGGSRPGETNSKSHWKPFQDNNGVSGHSFMGAVPFINAAKMTDDPLLKTLYYAGSTLAPLSRINDDAHYPSQALLGWWMAYVAATAVDATNDTPKKWELAPFPDPNTTGIAIQRQW